MGIERLTRLRQSLETLPTQTLVGDAVAAHTSEIEEMVRGQLEQGRGKDGEKLEPKYKSGLYAKKKNGQNSGPGLGTPDLNLTGAYHRDIQARAYQTHLEIDNTNFKAKYLVPKYPNALGLYTGNVIRLQREIVLPFLKTRVRELLQP